MRHRRPSRDRRFYLDLRQRKHAQSDPGPDGSNTGASTDGTQLHPTDGLARVGLSVCFQTRDLSGERTRGCGHHRAGERVCLPDGIQETVPIPVPIQETVPIPVPDPIQETVPIPVPDPIQETVPIPVPDPIHVTEPVPVRVRIALISTPLVAAWCEEPVRLVGVDGWPLSMARQRPRPGADTGGRGMSPPSGTGSRAA